MGYRPFKMETLHILELALAVYLDRLSHLECKSENLRATNINNEALK